MVARRVLAGCLIAFATSASAQWSVGAGLDSRAVFRAVDLNDGRPSAHASLDLDGRGGTYAGASVTQVALRGGAASTRWSGWFGLARPFRGPAGLVWEAGFDAWHFARASRSDGVEAYGGLIGDGWTLRLHESPDYLGPSNRTLYAELDGGRTLIGPLRWQAHAGLVDWQAHADRFGRRFRVDASFGLAIDRGRWSLQLVRLVAQSESHATAPGAEPYAMPALSLRPVTQAWLLDLDISD